MEGLVISDAVKDLIINIINIVILFVIVRTLAYKPVKKFLDARKERIAKELSDAADAKFKADGELEKYNELIKNSRTESAQLVKKAESDAKLKADEIIETARQSAAEITEKARENAEKEREAKLSGMQGEITDLAFDISKKILSREVTDADNMRIADDFFAKQGGNR